MKSVPGIRNLTLCAMCAAITCVLSPVSIPLAGGVPVSLATFAVMLSGILLGAKKGAVSQLVYVFLGSAGLPVFAGWTGGIGVIAGMTGGYILGYIPQAWLAGLVYHRFGRGRKHGSRIMWMAIAMTAGTAALYSLGTIWFILSTGMAVKAAIAACVLPFIPGDILKMTAVAVTAPPIETAILKTVQEGAVQI